MKGLDISRAFFFEWGLPFLKEEFPDIVDRVAAGRHWGSDAIGADDKWSRDHAWGPYFELALLPEDFRRCGTDLLKRANAAAPEKFNGYAYEFFGKPLPKVGADTISGYLGRPLRGGHPPKRARDWLYPVGGKSLIECESGLYFLKHGPVFYDPLGEFSARRKAFSRYPKDVLLKRICDECYHVWRYGEYKFCVRLANRNDPLCIQMCLGHFIEAVMRLCLLLEGDFTPYWMWLPHEFKKLPRTRGIALKLKRLVGVEDRLEQKAIVLQVCASLRKRLVEKKMLANDEPVYGLGSREIAKRIKDRILRESCSG